jgi:hypothetical protein
MPTFDMYTIRCGRCDAHMGVCPSAHPMPGIYCIGCEDTIRAEMMGEKRESSESDDSE